MIWSCLIKRRIYWVKNYYNYCTDGKQSEAQKMIPDLIRLRDDVLIKLNDLQQEILEQKKELRG
ncbi:MAG: hypothetical protein LC437_09245 [Thiohalomonas sp.]|nr:hypothetical protein [Thiohalomonas sp.]